MADVHRGAGLDQEAVRGERTLKERHKLRRSHLVALDFELFLGVSGVIDVVRRVREDQIGLGAGH